jgi:acyl-[acyl-carrier-protein]-phospholipid O-acyltransferase/long-chain-fatty-acid--[acyl-carrier-protein] ligase
MLLHQQFVAIAKKYGSKVFIIDRTTGNRLTYSRSLIASLILVDKFQKYEQGFLGIMIPNSAGCCLAILGALMSGRTPVMINYVTGAAHNVEFAQRKCGLETIITSRSLLEKINCREIKGMVFIEDIMESISAVDKLKAAIKSKLPTPLVLKTIHRGDEDDNLLILFTSGSEREPKAVQLTHHNIVANIEGLTEVFNFSEKDSILANLPYFHVFGQTANLWLPIYHGMTIITYANPLDYKAICTIVREEKPTLMAGTPSFFKGYLRKSEPADFQSIRIALTGADRCPDSLLSEFLEKHKFPLLNAYGTTETSPAISVNTPEHNRHGSVGRILPNVQVRIECYETGTECAPGEVGKILVKGDSVMKGYLNDFEETSLHLRNGWYDTGDMGIMDADGYLWHTGRLRRFVKIGGEMISLTRVEAVLEKLLAEDVSCCVVEVPDALKGAKIVAVVTRKIDEKRILEQMSEQLPNIALPKQFIVIEDLPDESSVKVDFRSVAEMVRGKLGK